MNYDGNGWKILFLKTKMASARVHEVISKTIEDNLDLSEEEFMGILKEHSEFLNIHRDMIAKLISIVKPFPSKI
ncbi:MAG: hypothetical protein AAB588_03050 [Patescibacteria group bacterium]